MEVYIYPHFEVIGVSSPRHKDEDYIFVLQYQKERIEISLSLLPDEAGKLKHKDRRALIRGGPYHTFIPGRFTLYEKFEKTSLIRRGNYFLSIPNTLIKVCET